MVSRWKKAAALAVSVLCASVNLTIAFQFLALWRASKRDNITESEGLAGGWARGLTTLGGLATLYFFTAFAANIVGLVGIVRRHPRCVRFWRDFSIADFACTTTTTVLAVYASAHYGDLRNGLCEELSRHDDVMMELAELGVTLENCEQWSQRAVLALVGVLVMLHLVRLHLVITVSKIFARAPHRRQSSMQRIYILPAPSALEEGSAVVYAPVPLSALSEHEMGDLAPREAWIAAPSSDPHTHAYMYSRGRVGLPFVPGEPLMASSHEK